MRVQVWPADDGGCGHLRLIWPALELARQGADVTVSNAGPSAHWDRYWTGAAPLDARVIGCDPPDADVVVIQRPFRAHWAELIPHLHAHHVAVVVDLDDDFTQGVLPTSNRAWESIDPARNPRRNWQWALRAIRQADLLTVSTPALMARHPGAWVLRNYLPAQLLAPTPHVPHDPVRVGWAGNVESHPGDLDALRGVPLADLLATAQATAWQIGKPEGVADRLGVPVRSTGQVTFSRYHTALDDLDIGLVPLADSAFNAAKSWLKGLEYAARGLPFIASATPEYRELARHGIGQLARRPREWSRQLTELLARPDLAAERGEINRHAAQALTLERHAEQWWTAWQLAARRAQARQRKGA